MLYTVVPLERIYSCKSDLNTEKNMVPNQKEEFKDIVIEHGKVSAKRMNENYIVNRLESTNMNDYLDERYMPGAIISIIDSEKGYTI